MKIYNSTFKNADWKQQLENWQNKQIAQSSSPFQKIVLDTAYGPTQILSTKNSNNLPHLVFIPGFRTCGLYWDICDSIKLYAGKFQVHLINVIGQPAMSSGKSPAVKGFGYGEWLVEVLDGLNIESTAFAGASFGGQLIMKLSQVAPNRIKQAFLCNPGGLSPVRFAGIVANIPMMINPSDKNIKKMMQKVALGRKTELNAQQTQNLLVNISIAVRGFKNGAQFPYAMKAAELKNLTAPTYLMLGTDDLMFNYKKQISRAKKVLPNLVQVEIFDGIGHGIEIEPSLHKKIVSLLDQ